MQLKNRTLGPLEGQGGYSAVHIPAGPIAPIRTQWHVFYLPLSLNTISCVLKKIFVNNMMPVKLGFVHSIMAVKLIHLYSFVAH
jgi:hypothetical protein